jgi:type II secretory pathway component GspD/PulD (secretin)
MKLRTFAAVTLTMFAVPAAHALAADPAKQIAVPVLVPAIVPAPSDAVPQCVVAPAAPCATVPPTLPALAVPAPVCCAESWMPGTALDRLRKIAADHAATGASASYIVKLRNVAATDVEHAIRKHFGEKADRCTLVVDAKSNTLLASGEPAQVRRALDLAAALDVAPPQVVVSALVLNVSREFLATAGLGTEKGETAWSLSARETHMLTGLIRAEKNNGTLETLSRPQIQVAEKQTGFVQVGQDVVLASATEVRVEGTTTVSVEKPVSRSVGLALKLTPKFAGEAVLLQTESQYTKLSGQVDPTGTKSPVFSTYSAQSTASLKKGESLVLMTCSDKDTVTLVVLTPSAVVAPACPGWFTK